MHEGHRQRMLDRLKNAESGLQDHELLEILLYNILPRKNTNELAHALLDSFGSLHALFLADCDALMSVKGIGKETAMYLRNVFLIYERAREIPVKQRPDVGNFETLYPYVKGRFECRDCEFVELYSVDSLNRIAKSVYLTSHDTGRVSIRTEVVDKFFSEFQPHGVILAHNHLCNNSHPSLNDDVFTRKMYLYCSLHDAELLDHIIVSPIDGYSYRLMGRLDEIRREINYPELLEGHRP